MQSTKDTANAAQNRTADATQSAKNMTCDATQSASESAQQGKEQSAGFIQQVVYFSPFRSMLMWWVCLYIYLCFILASKILVEGIFHLYAFWLGASEITEQYLSCYRKENRWGTWLRALWAMWRTHLEWVTRNERKTALCLSLWCGPAFMDLVFSRFLLSPNSGTSKIVIKPTVA
jgi:hypothetical protein